jgi:hypothetical protein
MTGIARMEWESARSTGVLGNHREGEGWETKVEEGELVSRVNEGKVEAAKWR